jgi:TonB family protein
MSGAPGGETSKLRNPAPFVVSVCFHGGILVWVALGPSLPAPPPRTLYEREIRPSERIVWFNLRDKLPEVAPSVSPEDRLPVRARVKSSQTLLAGSKDDPAPAPMIWMPAPEVAAPKPVPLPNVVAVANPPKLVRPFVAPPAATPPPAPAAVLPDAPRVTGTVELKPLPLAPANPPPRPRAFTPPPEVRMQRQTALQLPEAPATAAIVEPNALPFAAPMPRPQRRRFVPPAAARASGIQPGTQPALPPAPEVAAVRVDPGQLPVIPRTFAPPLNQPVANAMAPSLSVEAPVPLALAPQASLAIVGLDPAKTTDIPAPPGSRRAGFSSGPQPLPEGAMAANPSAILTVPGLLVRSGARDSQPALLAGLSPTSRENLMAAARIALDSAPKFPAAPRAARVSEAPDPRMAGRVIYTIAIQMPNITSFSGSWIVWFAEHEPLPGGPRLDLRPPVPLNKVDPKYIAAAITERVEGKVRLAAVIRRDGHVDSIVLLQHLDDRLDRSAQEALAKWHFQPALREGSAVEVDAVFEIPFHVAPRPAR